MSKYEAVVDIFDTDYPAYVGTERFDTNSWEDAEKKCKDMSGGGLVYYLDYLQDKETNKIYGKNDF